MGTLFAALILALALLGWLSLFKLVPACTASLCRYRLWQLRDQLVDEIRLGAFDDPMQAKILLARTEGAIQNVDMFSALNMILVQISLKNIPEPEDRFNLAGLSERDRTRMNAHKLEFDRALIDRSVLGTPTGWVLLLLAIPIAICSDILRRVRGPRDGGSVIQDAKDQVAKEFEAEAVIALSGKGRQTEGLENYV